MMTHEVHGRDFGPGLREPGRSLWHGQEWRGHCIHGRSSTHAYPYFDSEVMRPDMIMKSIIPVVRFLHSEESYELRSWLEFWASTASSQRWGGISGCRLLAEVIINGKMDAANYSAYSGYAHLGAGLTVGMSSLAAGLAIGIVGDAGVRANAQQPRLFVAWMNRAMKCKDYQRLGRLVPALRSQRNGPPGIRHCI